MINEWSFVQKSIDELNRISENESNPEKAKQLMKQFLREMKKKVPEELKW